MQGYYLVFSLIAFAFSILTFFTGGVSVSLEGGTLAIVGICVTLIVGVSVVDTIRLHEMEKKINKLEETEKHLEKIRVHSNIAMHMSWGFAHLDKMPFTAFLQFEQAYKYALKAEDMRWIDVVLQCMEEVVKMQGDKQKRIEERERSSKKKIKPEVPKEIQTLQAHKAFRKRAEIIYKEIGKMANTT